MNEPFAAWIERDAVTVQGPDAVSFLQGQLSQEVAALAVGASAWSFLLQPQGKVDALVRVTKRADDDVLLDTDLGFGSSTVERLERFKLRVKAELAVAPLRCLAVRGIAVEAPTGGLALPALWPSAAVDLVGDAVPVPPDVPLVDAEAYERARIRAGVPVMGREITERTIPGETLLVPRTVSFTKGCYTGQELVARIDSRGNNVPRVLHRVTLDDASVPVGAVLVAGGKEVGSLTSVAVDGTGSVALGYVGRDVTAPAEALARWDGGEAVARIEPLPLVS